MKNKELSPVEVTASTLKRIKDYNPTINALITVAEEKALAEAEKAEQDIQSGYYLGPMHGIPIVVKDILQTEGMLTTGGSRIFSDWIPDEDAESIKKLKAAGAIVIGKANLHEFAMGATSENKCFGNVKNPWNIKRIPGGSSGGSAAATASGMAFGAVGTDTAGSVRLPAAMCGIVGFKPTYDLISRIGCFTFSWSLDHIGPMTRTVKDAAIMFDAMKKNESPALSFGEKDSLHTLKGMKIGFNESYMYDGIKHEVKKVIDTAFHQLEALGAELIPIKLPLLDEGLNALKIIAQSEVKAYHEPLLKKYGDLYGDDLRYRFDFGSEVSATEYINAQRSRNQFINQTMAQMEEVDALIGPTNIQEPFEIGTVPPEQAVSNMFTLGKTPLANILGFPSLSVSCGFTENHLPVGLQFIGVPYSDKKILQMGDCYELQVGYSGELELNSHYKQI